MLHKLGTFSDPLLDRQIRDIIDAINNPTMIHKTTGKPYHLTLDNYGTTTPVIVVEEIQ